MPRPQTLLYLCLCAELSSLTAHAAARWGSLRQTLDWLQAGQCQPKHINPVALDALQWEVMPSLMGN